MIKFRLPRKVKKQYKKHDPLFKAHWVSDKKIGIDNYKECCYKWFYK